VRFARTEAVALEDDSLKEQLRRLESEIGALCEVRDEVTRALHEEQLRHLQNARAATLARLLELLD
jgi:hypothetical protein